jgi:hypothetical protein
MRQLMGFKEELDLIYTHAKVRQYRNQVKKKKQTKN